jgi:chromosome segregation ATPase
MPGSWLQAFGLARASHLRSLADQVESAKARTGDLKGQLEKARGEVNHWKTRAEKTATRLAAAEQESERWKGKHVGLRAKFEQLATAEQHYTLAREHMLCLETKLDIVEGAIDALDRRTRAVLSTPPALEASEHDD